MGGAWGFPATSMNPGELPEMAARRICREKLHCDGTPGRFLGIMFQERNNYDIFLMDIEVTLCVALFSILRWTKRILVSSLVICSQFPVLVF
jgi:ADP-ribose pyrophosphatase YjhB (NUDIX family)